MIVDLTNYEIPTFEEKIRQSLDVIEYHMRIIFMAKRMLVDDGVDEDVVNNAIANIGREMDEKFMEMPYAEFRTEVRKDLSQKFKEMSIIPEEK